MTERRAIQAVSLVVTGIGIILLTLNIILGGQINVALPLVFFVLGGCFFILVFRFRQQWRWAVFFYLPGVLLIAFGIIFLINVFTLDWNSWAYAWLLLIVALGIGLLLVNNEYLFRPAFQLAGWIMTVGGLTLFALFGAIAGGLFIQIAAPIVLVLTGGFLYWLHRDSALSGADRKSSRQVGAASANALFSQPEVIVESLSSRELEVLRLIDAGLSNQEIADKLTVAPSTVKTHINNIYGKLGVQTRTQAINRARTLGILDS